jgi:hypothetical protein
MWESLALIEERLATRFELPRERLPDDDLAAILTVGRVLRTGEGTATFGEVQGSG